VNGVLVGCQATALQKVDWLLDMENKSPFTANEHYLGDYREKFLTSYHQGQGRDRLPQITNGTAKDPYEPALHHMASARAYFQGSHWPLSHISYALFTIPPVAFKRFTDMVPMTIDQELLRGLDWDRGLYSALTKGLEITGPGSLDKAKEYLQEPSDVVNRRENLLKKRERLQSAKRELQSL